MHRDELKSKVVSIDKYLGGFDSEQHLGRHSTRQSKFGSKKNAIYIINNLLFLI